MSKVVRDGCSFLLVRELWFPARVAHWQVEVFLILAIPTLQGILGWVTQLPDGGPDALAELDVELDGSNSVWIGIDELPPGSPSFRPHPRVEINRHRTCCFLT